MDCVNTNNSLLVSLIRIYSTLFKLILTGFFVLKAVYFDYDY